MLRVLHAICSDTLSSVDSPTFLVSSGCVEIDTQDTFTIMETPKQEPQATPTVISPPHKFGGDATCTICHDTLLDPVTTPCGHNYCKGCLDRWLKRSNKCPLDNCKLPKVDFEVNRVLQKLLWDTQAPTSGVSIGGNDAASPPQTPRYPTHYEQLDKRNNGHRSATNS